MTRFTIIAAWLLATLLATVVAWQVVGATDDQITGAPLTPVVAVTSGSQTSVASGGVTAPGEVTSPTEPSSTNASTTPSSSLGSTLPTTSSTIPGSTSPSSTAGSGTNPDSSTPPATTGIPATTTAVSDGGTVTVTGTEPRVELVAVVAAPGWTYEVTENDGDRVEVRFQNDAGDDIRIRCEWESGRLVADIDD